METPEAAWLRRVPHYLYLADLIAGRRVLEVGCGSGFGAQFLANQGAQLVVGIDADPSAIDAAEQRWRLTNLEFRREDVDAIELEDASFDCIVVPEGTAVVRRRAVLQELRRLLAPRGYLILSAPSADRPHAVGGVSYHELVDRLEQGFSPVRMVAQAPFVAVSLVEYGGAEPAIELDTTLVELQREAIEVTEYVAVCGGVADELRGFAIMQLPTAVGLQVVEAELGTIGGGRGEGDAAGLRRVVDELRADKEQAARLVRELRERVAGLEERLEQGTPRLGGAASAPDAPYDEDAWTDEDGGPPSHDDAPAGVDTDTLRVAEAMAAHSQRVRDLEEALEESHAYVDELLDELARARVAADRGERDRQLLERAARELEAELAEARTRAARAEGQLLRLSGAAQVEAPAPSGEVERLRAELAAAEEKLERTTGNWRQAEAKNDDVWRRVGELQRELEQHREDSALRASQQRQASQVALTRAMDEASKKLVSSRDDLVRSERKHAELEERLGVSEERRAELERHLEEAEESRARLETRLAELAPLEELLSADGTVPELVDSASPVLRARVIRIEHEVDAARALLTELERGLAAVAEARRGDQTPPGRAQELSFELGIKDAELTLLNVGVSSLQQRLRDLVERVQRARDQAATAPADAAALLERLAQSLS